MKLVLSTVIDYIKRQSLTICIWTVTMHLTLYMKLQVAAIDMGQLHTCLPYAVMTDIVGQMLDERCVREIFRPQKILTKFSLRSVFERLAHSSIMKLNSNAMEKVGNGGVCTSVYCHLAFDQFT